MSFPIKELLNKALDYGKDNDGLNYSTFEAKLSLKDRVVERLFVSQVMGTFWIHFEFEDGDNICVHVTCDGGDSFVYIEENCHHFEVFADDGDDPDYEVGYPVDETLLERALDFYKDNKGLDGNSFEAKLSPKHRVLNRLLVSQSDDDIYVHFEFENGGDICIATYAREFIEENCEEICDHFGEDEDTDEDEDTEDTEDEDTEED